MARTLELDTLRKISMLADLPPWQLEVVAEALEPLAVKKGTLIVEKGSDDGYTYFLSEGQIQLDAADGVQKTLTISGDLASTPIANLRPRIFSVKALSQVSGMRVPDIVLSAAGCNGRSHDTGEIRVQSPEQDARREAESRLSFHLYRDLKNNAAVLPSLPDLALRIRKTIDLDVSDAKAIARLVESDPAMAAKLMKAANSALYGGLGGVETTSSAVVRLGMKTTRQLVLSFALKEVFECNDPMIRKRMQALWKHSSQVAALCFVLAREIKGMDPEEALLIGLVHDVGAIPILNYSQKYPALTKDPDALEQTIGHMRGELGAMILRDWLFLPAVVAGARDAENWTRKNPGRADFTDLLIVAQVHEMLRKGVTDSLPPLAEISAINRVLGDRASPEKSLQVLHAAKEQVDEMRSVLKS